MTAKTILGLYGAGGFGREVMPFAREAFCARFGVDTEVYFVEAHTDKKLINDMPALSEEAFDALPGHKYFNVSISQSALREKIVRACLSKGIKPFSLLAPNTTIYDHNELGEGAILCPYTVITSNTRIGKFFHANLYSYIGHDCIIGDYVTLAPRVSCNGNVRIGNHAYVGTCATIKNGTDAAPLIIGEGAVIGMGAIVTKSVAPYTTVVGNPAKPLEKHHGEGK